VILHSRQDEEESEICSNVFESHFVRYAQAYRYVLTATYNLLSWILTVVCGGEIFDQPLPLHYVINKMHAIEYQSTDSFSMQNSI
jgi:hypothetical protein